MAQGRKTGGRDYTKGHGGARPLGSKDKFPRTAKRHVEWLLERYGTGGLLDAAMTAGLSARPGTTAPYCKMVIEHLKGAPDQTVNLDKKIVLSPKD